MAAAAAQPSVQCSIEAVDALPDATIAVAGMPTRVVCVRFSNQVMLVVSQLPTFGMLIRVEAESYPDGTRYFNTHLLMGARDDDELPDMVLLLARRLAEIV